MPWTTRSASLTARSLLSTLSRETVTELIVDTILQRHLRPIFSKSTTKLTSSGRPSQYPSQYPGQNAPKDAAVGDDEPLWKRNGLGVVSMFAWAVETSNVSHTCFYNIKLEIAIDGVTG